MTTALYNPNGPSELSATSFEIAPATSTELMERASIDCQIATAKRYPRDYSVVKRKMLSLATLDEETAESCFYVLNRQGKDIRGPSVRLAEIAASCFGNMRAAAQIVDNDGKTITARGICHDLETNSCFAVEVKRRITGKNGQTYSEDMQVVTGNAACSIALRNAIFKTVPFALIKPVYEQARLAAVGTVKTLAERRTRMLKAFAALGVNEARVLASLNKPGVEDIGLAELETLIGVHTAVKDGDQKIDDAFPSVPEKPVFHKPTATVTAPESKAEETPKPEEPVTEKPIQTPTKTTAASTPPQTTVAKTPDAIRAEVQALLKANEVTEAELVQWGVGASILREGQEFAATPIPKLEKIIAGWTDTVMPAILANRNGE